jgi:hypothetical protein
MCITYYIHVLLIIARYYISKNKKEETVEAKQSLYRPAEALGVPGG